jgi:hypothetical protein
MRNVRRVLIVILVVLVAAFLHYNLPQRDVVQVVGTDIKRMDAPDDPATGAQRGRDVRFINARTAQGATRVYRNEDTRFGWPPYGKFNSGDLAARAQSLARDGEGWVAIRHYGWRFEMFDMFPNAVGLRPVDGPDARLIPWFNIVFLTALGAALLWLWLRWLRFRERRIEPVLDDIGDGVEAMSDRAEGLWTRIRRLFGGGRG